MISNNSIQLPLSEKNKQELKSLISLGKQLAKRTGASCSAFIISYLVFIYFTKSNLYFIETCIIALICFTVVFILLYQKYYRIYLDLKSKTKTRYVLTKYEIISNKKDVFLKSKEPKLKIKFYDDINPYISIKQPLIIEMTKRSKILLFISHNDDNLLHEN